MTVLAALWLMPGGLALAATIAVTTVADENVSGPNCSLREAIASANGDADVGGCVGVGAYGADTLVFGSTLSLPATITLTDPAGALTVSSDVAITGPGAAQLAIDGNHTTQVFSITTGQVMMSDLTIQHANRPDRGGGGILNSGTLTLTNCALTGNSAGSGGAILNLGTLTLTKCTLTGNSAGSGSGGIDNNGTLTLANCTLSGNSGGIGGGIRNSATLTVTDSIFSGNTAGIGGGISNTYGEGAAVTGSTFSGNSAAGSGGGIFNIDAILTVSNSTFSGNTAAGSGAGPVAGGGGIANQFFCSGICGGGCGSVIVTNSTFSGNSAEAGAGGIDVGSYGCPTSVTNSIIANSSGANCGGGITDGGHNVQFPDTSCGATIPSRDPLLDPAGLQDNGGPTQTIALLPGSPAINAGDSAVCANPPVNGVDQRGFARPGSGHTECSIGAYEADALSPEPCVGDCDGTGSATIDEIITLVNIVLGNAQPSGCPHGVPSGAEVNVALIIQGVNNALNGCGVSPAEQACLTSGGTVSSAMCCASSGDFPSTCAIGACGCAPAASHEVRVCDCSAGNCFDGSGCVRQ